MAASYFKALKFASPAQTLFIRETKTKMISGKVYYFSEQSFEGKIKTLYNKGILVDATSEEINDLNQLYDNELSLVQDNPANIASRDIMAALPIKGFIADIASIPLTAAKGMIYALEDKTYLILITDITYDLLSSPPQRNIKYTAIPVAAPFSIITSNGGPVPDIYMASDGKWALSTLADEIDYLKHFSFDYTVEVNTTLPLGTETSYGKHINPATVDLSNLTIATSNLNITLHIQRAVNKGPLQIIISSSATTFPGVVLDSLKVSDNLYEVAISLAAFDTSWPLSISVMSDTEVLTRNVTLSQTVVVPGGSGSGSGSGGGGNLNEINITSIDVKTLGPAESRVIRFQGTYRQTGVSSSYAMQASLDGNTWFGLNLFPPNLMGPDMGAFSFESDMYDFSSQGGLVSYFFRITETVASTQSNTVSFTVA